MNRAGSLIASVFFVSFIYSPVGAFDSATSVTRKLQKSYESIRSIEADFEQIYRSKRFEDRKSHGHVWMEKPGKMRWDYDEPKGKVMVSDGEKITLYDPEDNQALVSSVGKGDDLPPPLSLLWGKGKITDEFSVEFPKENNDAKAGEIVLECIPKKPIPNVSKVFLFVEPGKDMVVTATNVIDALGGENRIRFTGLKRNPAVALHRFKFEIPKFAVRIDQNFKEN